jgi:hypothetical protein
MKWRGESMFRNIAKGTSLLIFENGYVTGQPPAVLAAGAKLQIRMGAPDEKWIDATVTEVASGEATMELSDGTKWKMTPRQPGELPTAPTWSGGPSEEWVIRSAV